MNQLDQLEAKSIHILREAYREFGSLCMLWSIGKDSTVMLWLARKAFFGHVPIPLVHVDTSFKIPQMIEYRDNLSPGNTSPMTHRITMGPGGCTLECIERKG